MEDERRNAAQLLLEELLSTVEMRSTARTIVDDAISAAVEAVDSSLSAKSSSPRHAATVPSLAEVNDMAGETGGDSPRPREVLLIAPSLREESPRPRNVLQIAPSPPLKPCAEPPIMMDFKVSLPAKWGPAPTPWFPGGCGPIVTSSKNSCKKEAKTAHLGGGAAGISEQRLLNLGYRKHMGKYRGFPYDCWSCCGTSERECTRKDKDLQDIVYIITDPRSNFGDPKRFVPPPSPPQMLSMSLGSTHARAVPPVTEPARLSGSLSREELSPGRRGSPSKAPMSTPTPLRSPLRRISLSLADPPTPSKVEFTEVHEAVARAEEATRAAIATARNVRKSISAQSRPGTISGAQKRESTGEAANSPANVKQALLDVRTIEVPATPQPIPAPTEHDDVAKDIASSLAAMRNRKEMEERVTELVDKAIQGERESTGKAVQTALKAVECVKAMEASARAACDDAQKHAKGQRAVLEQVQEVLAEHGLKLRGLAAVVNELAAKQNERERSEARAQRRLNAPRAPPPAPPVPPTRPGPRAPLSRTSPPRESRPSSPAPPPTARLHMSAERPLSSKQITAVRASAPPSVVLFRHRSSSSSSSAASVASAETVSRRSVSAPSRIGPPPSSLLPPITFAQPTASFPLHYSPPSALKPLPKRLKRQLDAAKQRKTAAGHDGPEQLQRQQDLSRSLSGIPEDAFAEAEEGEEEGGAEKGAGVLDGLNVSDITADEFDYSPTPARTVRTAASPATPVAVSTPAGAPATPMTPSTPWTVATQQSKADSPSERPLDRAVWWQGVMRRRAEALQTGANRV